ncbi:hypothetical protein BC831DRAFT_484685 [Entophlyctis helioformis]|nr:hypothetical protein BC831DRAFT_484685 [Entophlyctis helioformis]
MGRRMNPVALRLKGMMNWPSNVSHPFLQQYLKHVFQQSICGTPGIRSSTTGVWANVTLLATAGYDPMSHPLVSQSPSLDFRAAKVEDALGRLETRTRNRTTRHTFYKSLFLDVQPKSLAAALGGNDEPLKALQIYRDTPIVLKINIIRNPLLNAEIMAEHVARSLNSGKSLARVYKEYLTKLG